MAKASDAKAAAEAATKDKPTPAAASAAQKAKELKDAEKKAKVAEEARKKAEAEAAKLQQANTKWLTKAATTINGVIKRMEGAYDKVSDFRATLAVNLSEAEEVCKSSKLSFREWADANIQKRDESGPYSFPELRRLTKIGRDAQGDEAAARETLEELRKATAERVKKHSDAKKLEQQEAADARQQEAKEREETAGAGHNGGPSMDTAANVDPAKLMELYDSLSAKSKLAFLEKLGETEGLTIVVTKSKRQVWPKGDA